MRHASSHHPPPHLNPNGVSYLRTYSRGQFGHAAGWGPGRDKGPQSHGEPEEWLGSVLHDEFPSPTPNIYLGIVFCTFNRREVWLAQRNSDTGSHKVSSNFWMQLVVCDRVWRITAQRCLEEARSHQGIVLLLHVHPPSAVPPAHRCATSDGIMLEALSKSRVVRVNQTAAFRCFGTPDPHLQLLRLIDITRFMSDSDRILCEPCMP